MAQIRQLRPRVQQRPYHEFMVLQALKVLEGRILLICRNQDVARQAFDFCWHQLTLSGESTEAGCMALLPRMTIIRSVKTGSAEIWFRNASREQFYGIEVDHAWFDEMVPGEIVALGKSRVR